MLLRLREHFQTQPENSYFFFLKNETRALARSRSLEGVVLLSWCERRTPVKKYAMVRDKNKDSGGVVLVCYGVVGANRRRRWLAVGRVTLMICSEGKKKCAKELTVTAAKLNM